MYASGIKGSKNRYIINIKIMHCTYMHAYTHAQQQITASHLVLFLSTSDNQSI